MGRFLGLTPFQFALRVIRTLLTSIIIFALAFYVPSLIFQTIGLPFEASRPVYLSFTILLTALGALAQIFKRHAIGISASVALAVAGVIYLVTITNFGHLRISAMGLDITLEFPLLLHLFVVSGSIGVISTILSVISRSASEPVKIIVEEVEP